MKHFALALLLTVVLVPASAFANSVNNFSNLNVNFDVFPNSFGDNVSGLVYGSGVMMYMIGGTPYYWFSSDTGASPGSIGGGQTTIYFDTAFGTIGSQTYGNLDTTEVTFNAGTFTFPTNGRPSFNVTVPASIDVITLMNCTSSGCQTFNLGTRPGKLTLSFYYSSSTGMYFGSNGSFTTAPEPATLGLVGLGMSAIGWMKRKRKSNSAIAASN